MDVEHLEDALRGGDGLLQVCVDATELLGGAVHQEERCHKRREFAGGQPAGRDLPAAVPERGGHAESADELHERWQARQGRRDLHVRPKQLHAGTPELCRLAGFGPKGLHDAVPGERFDADMRQPLERFLTASRGASHALPEADQWIHDERCARQAHNRQPRVIVEEQRRVADERERLASQIARCFRDHLLHLVDVVVDARRQLSGGSLREEARRLTQDVAIEGIAHVHDHALADVRHEVRRHVRPQALDEIQQDDRPGHRAQSLLVW